MANDIPIDPLEFSVPTQEELDDVKERLAEEERQRQKTVSLALDTQERLESQLPTALPTQPIAPPSDVGPFPMRAAIAPPEPLNLPVSSGRMYMGPAMSAEEEAAFRAKPSGTSINLVPPPAVTGLSGLERAQALDRPGTRTISIGGGTPTITSIDPASQRFAAIQGYQSDLNAGMDPSVVQQKWAPFLFAPGRSTSGMMTENQRVNAEMRAQQLGLQEESLAERKAAQQLKAESGWQDDPDYKANVAREKEIAKNIDLIDALPKPTPKQERQKTDLVKEGMDLIEERNRIKQKYSGRYKVTRIK